MQKADLQRKGARAVQSAAIQKGQVSRPCGGGFQQHGIGAAQLGRGCPGKGAARGDPRFRKAGVRPVVEGEGLTGRIGKADRAACVQRGAELRLQVTAGEIHVLRDDESRLGQQALVMALRLRLGRHGRQQGGQPHGQAEPQ